MDQLTFETADVLSSEVTDDGEVRLTIGLWRGNEEDSEVIDEDVAVWSPDGIVSRPNDPDAEGACRAIYITDGDETRVIGLRDNRYSSKVGGSKFEQGDRSITSSGEARILLKKSSDGVTAYTKNQETDMGMVFDLNGKTGMIMIQNTDAAILIKKDEILLSAGGSSFVLGSAGLVVNGDFANTGNCNLGGLGSVATPAVHGPVGISGVGSSKVFVSP